jgi:hypothetical protein
VRFGKKSNLNKNDFTDWKTEIIVIELETNDQSGWNSPTSKDPTTGKTFKDSPSLFEERRITFL